MSHRLKAQLVVAALIAFLWAVLLITGGFLRNSTFQLSGVSAALGFTFKASHTTLSETQCIQAFFGNLGGYLPELVTLTLHMPVKLAPAGRHLPLPLF